MIKKHTPLVTKYESTKYKRMLRRRVELFNVEKFSKTQEMEADKSLEKSVLQRNIRKLFKKANKESRTSVMQKSLVPRKNAPSLKRLAEYSKATATIAKRMMAYTTKKNSGHGNIGMAMKDYPPNYTFHTRNLTTKLEDKLANFAKCEQYPISRTMESMQKITRNVGRIKELMRSIDSADQEMNMYAIDIQNFTKGFEFKNSTQILQY
eukprot:TRINITY_DN10751_c0_g1_i2.p1 TRINITY_DN10751_c0_g1~~TRINITY_DN10751_c0_g1_i2.p1  ORF type:complete len:208 (-),score=39.19 TRINITY_DN10751_c0_g1_i2:53-676(-)